ncbi:MAG: gamma-glutamyltransferase [Acetobacteraceae bacterium]
MPARIAAGRRAVYASAGPDPEETAVLVPSLRSRHARRLGAGLLALLLAGCGGPSAPLGAPAAATGPFQGAVVAPEPEAALVGRQVLAAGGDAADAAVAMGFTLAVTLPSRVGLGGSGACLSFTPGGMPRAVLFPPQPAPLPPAAAADRPAALPGFARGMYLLHATAGHLPFGPLLRPAADAARRGVPVSRVLAADLRVVATPLLADPAARALFAGPDGAPLRAGQVLRDPALAATLQRLGRVGVGDLYQGLLSRLLVQDAAAAGGPMTAAGLRATRAWLAAPIVLPAGRARAAFLPPPADGGLAAAAAFQALRAAPSGLAAAQARALAVAAAWRAGQGAPAALLADANLPAAGLGPLPASTSFLAVDRKGGAVACATTMGNLFGTGRVLPQLGFLLGASPARTPPPLLAAAMAWDPGRKRLLAAVAGSGQDGAGMAVGAALADALASGVPMPRPVPAPGRAQVILCPHGAARCTAAHDPRGFGLALSR